MNGILAGITDGFTLHSEYYGETLDRIFKAINKAIEESDAQIINMSFGFARCDKLPKPVDLCIKKDDFYYYKLMYEQMFRDHKDVLFVAAAGNSAIEAIWNLPGGGARASNLISVAATETKETAVWILNDTGITWSGDATSGNATFCDPAHPAGQDCHYGRDAQAAAGTLTKVGGGNAGFDFTKIANNGSELPASATLGSGPNDWACTRDNVTGLIWEVKVDDCRGTCAIKPHLHLVRPEQPGRQPGTQNGGTCVGSACDTTGFVQAVNAQGLCGPATGACRRGGNCRGSWITVVQSGDRHRVFSEHTESGRRRFLVGGRSAPLARNADRRLVDQHSVRSAISSASSTSMPRYLTVLSSLLPSGNRLDYVPCRTMSRRMGRPQWLCGCGGGHSRHCQRLLRNARSLSPGRYLPGLPSGGVVKSKIRCFNSRLASR
jgi:hypothetical protein